MDALTLYPISGISSREVWARGFGLSTGKVITSQPSRGPPVKDTVELSPAGIALSRADVQSPPQVARIREFRAEIKAGTFLTPERMAGTVERLLKVIG